MRECRGIKCQLWGEADSRAWAAPSHTGEIPLVGDVLSRALEERSEAPGERIPGRPQLVQRP